MVVSKHAKKKRREETTPFGVNSMRSRVLYRAAHVWNMHCDTQPPICIGCRHGFVGILLLAAWPNAAFDLCGICCGHFLMPFWDFFGATFIGKALLKVHPPSCLPESSVSCCCLPDFSVTCCFTHCNPDFADHWITMFQEHVTCCVGSQLV